MTLVLCLITSNLFSQDAPAYQRDFSPKTPEAASFNKYGDFSVGYFTGRPNISLPIPVSEEIPIELSYDASGHKPEQHHSWVGLGWDLGVGGMITRVKKGLIDEFQETSNPNNTQLFGYFEKKGLLNVEDWKTSLPEKKVLTLNAEVISSDLEADEFVFNFGNYSGSFMMNHLGNWVFRGNNPEEFEMKNVDMQSGIVFDFFSASNFNLNRIILGFTIVAKDGTEYTFGGDKKSVDFTCDFSNTADRWKTVTPSAWHLTKIKEITGKETIFTYEKDGFSLVLSRNRNMGMTKFAGVPTPTFYFSDSKSGQGIINSYLTKIETAYEVVRFYKTKLTNIADYGNLETNAPENSFGVDLTASNVNRKWFRLDAIKSFSKNNGVESTSPLRHFAFDYTNFSTVRRLQLEKVRQIDVDNTNAATPVAAFTYNATELPEYGTAKIDHWGYYNGGNKGMFASGVTTGVTTDGQYNDFRTPDTSAMKAEIIEKITYPTGGYTIFDFEAHDYGKAINKNPVGISSNSAYAIDEFSQNQIAGGLRIKKITNHDGLNAVAREFFYHTNYEPNGSVNSSGVLDGTPQYFDKISQIGVWESWSFCNEQALNPLNLSLGSPVSYSEVAEQLSDGSYTIYKYSNADQAVYRNKKALTGLVVGDVIELYNPVKDPQIDYGQMRGRLLEQCVFNAGKNLVKKVQNTYTASLNDPSAIRSVRVDELRVKRTNTTLSIIRKAVAYLVHTSPIFLTKTITKDYFFNPTAEIETVTENTYDSRKNITKQKVTHLDNTDIKSNATTDYFYAYDPTNTATLTPIANATVSESVAGIKQRMLNKFMIGIPLQTKNNFNKGTKVEFGAYDAAGNVVLTTLDAATDYKILPYKYFSQNRVGTTFTEQFRINSYTQFDRPTETQSKGTNQATPAITTKTTYEWQDGLLKSKTMGPLTWTFYYDYNKRQLTSKMDENGLRMRFSYDGYRRLIRMEDRYKLTDPMNQNSLDDLQAYMEYDYVYRNVSNANEQFSLIRSRKWFKNVTNSTANTDKMVSTQYLDGLGRPISVIKEYYTPEQQHQKNYMLYDNQGRPEKSFQPIKNSNILVDGDWGSSTNSYATFLNNKTHIRTVYEKSPLSRPETQILEDGRTIETRYYTNGTNEVSSFTPNLTPSGDNLLTVSIGTYAPNTLFKTVVWDENGTTNQTTLVGRYVGRTEIFKDKLGRVVLTRKFVKNAGGSFVNVDTYNVYDDYSNLVMVIPPGAINAGVVDNNLTFQYRYDNLYRLAEKKVPGAKSIKFYYNDRDQMVLMQDGNMRNTNTVGVNSNVGAGRANKYLATLFDAIGRPVKTGFTGTAFPTLTNDNDVEVVDAHIVTRLTSTEYYTRNANGGIDANGAFSTNWVKHQEGKVLKNNAVSTVREAVWSYIERRPTLEHTGNPVWTGKQHLLCTTKQWGWLEVGDGAITDNDYDGVDWRVSAYNGAQMPWVTYHYAFSTNYAQQVRTADFPTFDHALRMTKLDHAFSMGGNGLPAPTNISNMVYNYKDQLTEKNLGYNSNYNKYLQSIDYEYNTRGWLTKINQLAIGGTTQQQMQIMTPQSPSNGTIQNLAITPFINQMVNDIVVPYKNAEVATINDLNDDNVDLYRQSIKYDNPDSRFGNPDAQYNGNISNTFWQVAGRAIQGYGFKYDDLNRLTEGNYYDVTYGITPTPMFEAGKFTEKVTEYDLRGNIKKLQRFGFKEPSINFNNDVVGNYGEIDNLIYDYDPANPNRIRKITDGTTIPSTTKGFRYANSGLTEDYKYDDNGNLKYDRNKNIKNIEYNYLNLPETIDIDFPGSTKTAKILFVYDAAGQKHRKIARLFTGATLTTETITDYVGGYEYTVSSDVAGVYASVTNSLPSRIHHTEGAITKEANSTDYQYEFALRDHLGNTRVTFKDKNNDATLDYWSGDPTTNEIAQINHYYPFGLNMEGNWNGQNGANKYQYNGKELNDDFGLGLSDYGARFYDAAIGRWHSVDPLSAKFVSQSSYCYAGNRPSVLIDVRGLFQFDPQTLELMKMKYPTAYKFFVEQDKMSSFGNSEKIQNIIIKNTRYYQASLLQSQGKSISGEKRGALQDADQRLTKQDISRAFSKGGGQFIKLVHEELNKRV